jgi:small subunit ribosomal protein S6
MTQQQNIYETTFIVNASLDDPQIETVIIRSQEIITKNGGEIKALNKWGRKRLAYPIQKKNNGFYVNIDFTSPAAAISQLEHSFTLDENVLRFLTIKLDKKAIKARENAPQIPTFVEQPSPELIENVQIGKEPLFEDDVEAPLK